jgi:hypothetical protein
MDTNKYLGCRSNDAEIEDFRRLAADLAALKPTGRVTVSDILRRCIYYGKPFVEREAAGEVIPGASGMTQYEQTVLIARKAVEIGLQHMQNAIPSSSSQL